ncbi:ribonuclease E/G [Lachnospiraceae bacterium MD1]|uniref:Ribonuclease E/G n=1 Tax=Variimorphobacter saccharofermentans TaxID=2755051 RepID=A0A839JZ24_9FIRM|nr:ribonuclease E/G [Variimorphobacter saccharofermentans]MBB2182925.1 ribonuclease E/G [Variimorphobacter saccharofermentans]
MENKLVITRQDNTIISAFFEGKDMVQVSLNASEEEGILGNIYLGKVKNIVKNINAAFVEIAEGRMCYYSLDENRYPILANQTQEKEVEGRLTETKVKVGDELLVQVVKEEVKTKAPVVSSNLNFTGKYVALTYGKRIIGVSSKISEEKERIRLKNIAKQFESSEYGFIIRTNAAYMPEEKIINEINKLIQDYEDIRKYGVHKSRFSLLYQTPPNYICDIRDGYADHVDEFITDDKELYDHIRNYLERYQAEDKEKLRFYDDQTLSLGNLYGINERLNHAIRPMVWLKSGGSLVIQPTEALTVIDVNTGKAIAGKKKVQETFLKVNREAAKEIAKQIRLRNLSGIIIIDFIDMELTKDKELLMEEFEEYLKKDPIKTTLVDMTALGLVEVTRKKVRKPLHEQVQELIKTTEA